MLNERQRTGHAVVIGAGQMGTGIAAVLANAGWTVDLLDRVPDGAEADAKSRSRLAADAVAAALKASPPHFGSASCAARIRPGNTEDDLERAKQADWVVEAVVEDLEAKQELLLKVASVAGPGTVVSSNTSALPLAAMVESCPPEFRRRFLGTHFFNPPRQMRPVEVIPTRFTDRNVLEGFERFADRVLGKRVIRARDTPGFISTRLGMYALSRTIQIACERSISVEQADYLTGPPIGRPRSGTFRLADLVGLDIVARVADDLRAALPNDPEYAALELPAILRNLIADGRTGAKAGAGFYRREKNGTISSLDLATGDYRQRADPEPLPADLLAMPLKERLKQLWKRSPELDGGFLRTVLADSIGYMARHTEEVAERIVEVDDALRGGFGWELGPFHTLDALAAEDWSGEPPKLLGKLRESGHPHFYAHESGHHSYFDFKTARMASLHRPPEVIVLKDLRRAERTVEESDRAAMVDLGRGVLCVSWNTKLAVLDSEIVEFLDRARQRAERDYAALVVAGGDEAFGAGYDLKRFFQMIRDADWAGIDAALKQLQSAYQAIKASQAPVVASVTGYVLGGSCEMMLHSASVQAGFESRIGLPEAKVGLLPAAGGIAQLLLRAEAGAVSAQTSERRNPTATLMPVWKRLCEGAFTSSALEAREQGWLRRGDGISPSADRLLHDARERALVLAAELRPAESAVAWVPGEEGMARLRWETGMLRHAGKATEHDERVWLAIGSVLCGGSRSHSAEVTEQELLDLEREAFLSLAGTPETLARIERLLSTGKHLRN